MKYYLAPLEGITTYVYRNAIHEIFGDHFVKYFTPFFAPNTKRHRNSVAMRGILPENNQGIKLVPQILTKDAEDFLKWEHDMRSYGYDELNINIGCPSGTVISKNRGAGFLRVPDKIDEFLYGVFEKTESKVSVKTRLGMDDPEEFCRILEVYNKYPLEELIIHARVGKEMYSGTPHIDMFRYATEHSRNRLVYNGDIFDKGDIEKLCSENDKGNASAADTGLLTDTVMLGRGAVANPALARKMEGGAPATKDELTAFFRKLKEDYLANDPDENHTLLKLKEVWAYAKKQFADEYPKEVKALIKAKRLEEFVLCERKLLDTMK